MFKFLLLSLLFSIELFAQNPKLFATLGDTLYNNVDNVKKLEKIVAFKNNFTFINSYVKGINALWADGMLLDDSSDANFKKEYLNSLRKLSKEYDNIMRSVNKHLEQSIKNKDAATFSAILNSNLIELIQPSEEILLFYTTQARASYKVEKIELYLEAIEKASHPDIVAEPTKLERIEAQERAKDIARKKEQDKIEREKKAALIKEQVKESL